MSESFEGYAGQLVGGWAVFGTMSQANCASSLCQGKSWGTTNAGVEVDQLSAIATGDGVQYGQSFAELDSDCNNRVGAQTAAQTAACSYGNNTTNSSINMTFDLRSVPTRCATSIRHERTSANINTRTTT